MISYIEELGLLFLPKSTFLFFTSLDNLTRNKLMFEFSLVSPTLKMYIDAIAFSMKECLLLFHDIIYRRVWSTFFPKSTFFYFKISP